MSRLTYQYESPIFGANGVAQILDHLPHANGDKMQILSDETIRSGLSFDTIIPVIAQAMINLSRDERDQPLREIVEISSDRLFGVMPGRLSGTENFGAKLVSVFPEGEPPRHRHKGVVVLFEGERGDVTCVADAEAITAIRTAAATAVATQALARSDACHLAIYGSGQQAAMHLASLMSVRTFQTVTIWGRSAERVRAFAEHQSILFDREIAWDTDGAKVARASDIICTVTSSPTPILHGDWVTPGTHVNLVGSSFAGPAEADSSVVAMSRFFVDSRRSALKQAAEFLIAREAGLVQDGHIIGEIGEVLEGVVQGRCSDDDRTVYKSLGHIVQDLAAVRHLHQTG